jgi:hypothetical protein
MLEIKMSEKKMSILGFQFKGLVDSLPDLSLTMVFEVECVHKDALSSVLVIGRLVSCAASLKVMQHTRAF